MAVKAVMFDFGATIVLDDRFDYSVSLRKTHKVLESAGIAPCFEEFVPSYLRVREKMWNDAELREFSYNYRLSEVLKLYGFNVPESDKRLLEATEVFSRCLIDSLYMEDFVPDLLRQLHIRFKLAVVSNLGIPEVVPITLDRFDIKKHFDFLLASGTVGYRKPSPVIFEEALKALGVSREETVFVGDSLYHDVQGAQAVDMKTVWLRRENQSERKVNVVPDKTIDTLRELPIILETL